MNTSRKIKTGRIKKRGRRRNPEWYTIRIRQLLKEGRTVAEIKKTLRVSAGTVYKVKAKKKTRLAAKFTPPRGRLATEHSSAVGVSWCSGCGHNVLKPCLKCTLVRLGKAKE